MSYVRLSDLGQSTNLIQAQNAYSRARTVLGQGNMALARNYASELQFTYNNAKNAGNDSEAQEILRLINLLNSAMSPSSAPVAAPSSFQIDMSTTRVESTSTPAPSSTPSLPSFLPSIFAPSDDNVPPMSPMPGMPVYVQAPRPAAPNYALWGGLALGATALVIGGVYFATQPSKKD